MSVFLSMTLTALCRAFNLLCCRKLEMPLYAKPITLEAMPPNTEAIIPLFCFLSFGYGGNIKPISFFNISYAEQL